MTRGRFLTLRRNFNLINITKKKNNNTDKFIKVSPLYDAIYKKNK